MTGWCRMYAEQCEMWTAMGGVPDDHSTREAASRVLLALWAEHRALQTCVDELLDGVS